jgi:hypothetical protein
MIPKVAALAIFSAILFALLDSVGFKSKGLFASLCALMIFSALGESLTEIFGSLVSIAERTGISEAASCALKAVGLGYVFGITSDICTSLGEKGIATAVVTVGRVQIFALAYPYFEKMIALGMELLG